MKKPKSLPLLDDKDFPINRIRQTMIRGTGTDIEELRGKPLIAVVNSHTELHPGHMHLGLLAEKVKNGVHAAGGIPFEFNVPAPCDGMTEGHEGMRYILPQRELIADMVETHVRSMLFDGMVMIASCDKIIPGMIMAAARLDLPTIFLTGGPSIWQGRLVGLKRPDSPNIASCGACDLMGTANTFQCLAEVLGLTIPGSANIPGFHTDKLLFARQSGKRIVQMVEEGLSARKILTAKAIENAVIMDLAIGGSTNSTLHLPAIAHELGLTLPLSRFNELNKKIPTLLSITPSGPHLIMDLYAAGGIPAVMKVMAEDLNLEAMTVTGQTFKEVIKSAQVMDETIIPPRDKPYLPEGGTVILFGNLAPDGAVIKQSAVDPEMRTFTGQALVMDSEADALKAFREGVIKEGDVIVIRYEGPKGGPGMPETLAVTMAIMTSGLKRVALITDGRFSGGTHGFVVGHITPEAYGGGPLALVKNGDRIVIDAERRQINLAIPAREMAARRRAWRPVKPRYTRGVLAKYASAVTSASLGAVTDQNLKL